MGSAAWAAEKVVFEIGTPDGDYKELAIAGTYPGYKDFMAKPIVFEAGKSKAQADWPFIQPGPVDSWAGGRMHPRTIRFDLAEPPRGVFTFRVNLIDVQKGAPPILAVTIGGRTGEFRLPAGGGDASLTDPKAGQPHKIELALPADIFQQGANDIVLSCIEGSWIQYDAVTLTNDPDARMPQPEIQTLTVAPTPFYVRTEGGVARAVEVTVGLTVPAGDFSIRVEAGGQTVEARSRAATRRSPGPRPTPRWSPSRTSTAASG